MPLEVGETINKLADKFMSAPAIMSVAKNPIYTALMITFIIVLLVMFIFRNVETEESLLTMCLRTGFWVFILLVGTLFIHNKVLMTESFDSSEQEKIDQVFNRIGANELNYNNNIDDSFIPVNINTYF
jgi:hypothetical protein